MNEVLGTLGLIGAVTFALFGYFYLKSNDFKRSAAEALPLGAGLMFFTTVLHLLGL